MVRRFGDTLVDAQSQFKAKEWRFGECEDGRYVRYSDYATLEQKFKDSEAERIRLREAVQVISRYVEHSARWAPDRIGILREIGEMCDRALAAEQGESK